MGYGQVRPSIPGGYRHWMSELWDGYDPNAARLYGGAIINEDDFANLGSIVQNVTSTDLSGYGAFTSNNSTTLATAVKQAAAQGGGLLLQTSADDNAEANIVAGGNVGFRHAFVTAEEDDTWPYTNMARVRFECRFSVSSVTNNDVAFFAGMTNSPAETALLQTDTSALQAAAAFVGFRTLQASASTLQFVFQNVSETVQNVVTVATIAANTWYRVGFEYNPWGPDDKKITIWYNDAKLSTYVTAAQIAAATFPKSTDSAQVLFTPGFVAKNGSAVTGGAQFRCTQYRCVSDLLTQSGSERI